MKITEAELNTYMAKKALKHALKNAKKLKSHNLLKYSNDSNPFGDVNLNETFVWRKKIERDIIHGVPLDAYSLKAEKKRQRVRMVEMDNAKRRRVQRAFQKAQHDEEMALLARQRASAEFQDWEKKEEEFHFKQIKLCSQIRLREGRPKPIDVLTKFLNSSDVMDLHIKEPYMIFNGLTVKEMEELRDDIKMHLDLDEATETHTKYWNAFLIVCDWEIAETQRNDALDQARLHGKQPPPELLAEERGLHSSVQEDVQKHLQGKSKMELEEYQVHIESEMQSGKAKIVEFWEAVLKHLCIYKAKACLREIHAKMQPEHLHRLEQPLEHQVEVCSADQEEYGAEVKQLDKYRPRKPKYSSRIYTGYEWNKYNQTHYDHDNPPPKVIKGYEFNIFYPDLVDKTKAPKFDILNDGNSSGTRVIRFQAGPPYEDIAFRIVNKEWEYSAKKGYRCTFERGILHVHFNLKRYRYRR